MKEEKEDREKEKEREPSWCQVERECSEGFV